ncbi:hypothetical protein N2152v2_008321 [Parachlorella kessleri]
MLARTLVVAPQAPAVRRPGQAKSRVARRGVVTFAESEKQDKNLLEKAQDFIFEGASEPAERAPGDFDKTKRSARDDDPVDYRKTENRTIDQAETYATGIKEDAYETIKERNVKNFGQNDNDEYEGGRAPVWEPADAARDMNEGNMSEVAEINKGDDKGNMTGPADKDLRQEKK